MTPEDLAKAYNARGLIDYGEHRGEGLLVATGAGLMMCAMDLTPAWRWSIDIGGGRAQSPEVCGFLEAVAHVVPHIGVAAWWSITRPTRLRDTIANLHHVAVFSQPALGAGVEVESLDALAALATEWDRSAALNRAN